MIATIRSEWIKFFTVRSTVVLLVTGGFLTVLFAGITINSISGEQDVYRLSSLTSGVVLATFLFGALGVQILGQEYRFNTIRTTFTATPRRWRVLVAKMVVVAAAVAVVSLIMMAICALLGALLLDPFEVDAIDIRVIWGTALFAAGWALFGLGVGAILRQPIAGIIVLLMWGFVAEQIIASLFTGTARWMPFLNGVQMTFRNEGDSGDIELLSTFGGGIYFFIVVAVVLAIGAFLAERRDA